jgi:hypothetical protein
MNRYQTVLSIICVLFLANCTGFQREWKAANAAPYQGIEGPWEGTWKSAFNGHGGKLRCIVTKKENNQYEYHYWATWGGFLSGSFRTIQEAIQSQTPGIQNLTGEKDLGALGGIYRFTGTTTDTTLNATYSSDGSDTGVFNLTRP